MALAFAGAFQVVRSAAVERWVASRPDLAAKMWPGHPRVSLALAMAEIGRAAQMGQPPSAITVARSLAAARRAPLAVEPFLIHGAIAQSEKREAPAERLLLEAARRDPRSSAARHFMSQIYLSSGRTGDGLRHASVLVRLVSGASSALVPAISQYAKSPGAVPTLRKMFAGDRELGNLVLSELARDSSNYGLIMALAGSEFGKSQSSVAPVWQAQLLRSLIGRGELTRARALWLRISGLNNSSAGIFNPQFAKLAAPPPFNWTFGGGDFGFAEPAAGASLQVIYYGRTDAQFASQTLLLRQGRYELRARVKRESEGGENSGLAWTIGCGPASDELLNLPIGEIKSTSRGIAGIFTVPAGCPSQTIRLVGTMREYASSEQVTISDLQLVRL